MARSKLIPARHRIRVQMMFWTSALLLIAIAGPLEWRLRIASGYVQQDLIDRSLEVVNGVAADLGGTEFLETEPVQAQLLSQIPLFPSIVELSVYELSPTGNHVFASTVEPPDVTPESLGAITPEPQTLVGSRGERLIAVSRMVPNHPGFMIIAVTTLEEVDRFSSINRRSAFLFTFGGIVAVVLLLNFIFQRNIGRPFEEILAVMEKAHVGDYSDRVPEVREDETGKVAQTLNELMDR